MTFDELIGALDAWLGEPVVLTLLPEDTTLRGRLTALDAAGIDGALYGLADGDGAPSGVALALFRDAVVDARREGEQIVVQQGQMVLRMEAAAPPGPEEPGRPPTCGGRRSGRG
jgi:hypothetical protein